MYYGVNLIILVADDDSSIREMICDLLEELFPSAQFIEASNGAEASEKLALFGNRLSFVISDFHMPNGNGDVVFEAWKEYAFHTPFILFSSEVKTAKKALLKGNSNVWNKLCFVEKSGDFHNFQKAVESLSEKGHVPLGIKELYENLPLKVPVFVAINNNKMVKVAHESSSLAREQIDKLIDRGVGNIYVSLSDALRSNFFGPIRSIHDFNKKNTLNFQSIFDNFKNTHLELLESTVLDQEKLGIALNKIEKMFLSFKKSKIESILNSNNFSSKDYVYNHSLLLATFGFMGLEEINLDNDSNKRTLLKACLFHDLILDDEQAFREDILAEKNHVDKIDLVRRFRKMMNLLPGKEFSSDLEITLESLVRGIKDKNYRPRSGHKLAQLLISLHKLINDLYLDQFVKNFSNNEIESYSDSDKQIHQCLSTIFLAS